MAEAVIIPPSAAEQLTAYFYAWEIRGRGWDLWEEPVALEPPFRPFLWHTLPPAPLSRAIDDARKPTRLGALFERLRDSIMKPNSCGSIPASETEPVPETDAGEPVAELALVLPSDCDLKKDLAEQLVLALASNSRPVAFEIIAREDAITIQIACRKMDRAEILDWIASYIPEAVVEEQSAFLRESWNEAATQSVIVEFGLAHEFMRPLATVTSFNSDPLVAVIGALRNLARSETAVLQVLFQGTRQPWADSIARAVTNGEGGAFFLDAPEMLALMREKISRPLCAAVIRAAARSAKADRSWELVRNLGNALGQLANPPSNELIALDDGGYDPTDHERDLLTRTTHRSGMLLNTEELVTLVHPPTPLVRCEKLRRETKRSKAAPETAHSEGIVLGENVHRRRSKLVTLSSELRMRHTYVIGASGTGKSTLLLNLIAQDLASGEGFGVLDPHGDLIDAILELVPEERLQDVVLFDPSDGEFPIGFNILSAHSELERNLLASDLVAIFRRFSTSWGDQMNAVLSNAVLAFLERPEGGTLIDLRRFLVEPEFRKAVLREVEDPEVVYYFGKEFPLLSGRPQAPILTRLNTFLRPKVIRHMVAQRENRLDLSRVMNDGKIFLAKLSQGAIGEENAHLLGAFLVAKFHQLVMGRQALAASARRSFVLYIDEFHHFVTPSVAALLSGARKYRLGLVLAHQELRQLWDQDPNVASAVLTNPATRVCFRVGDFDAKKLQDGFASFDARDLQSLGIGEAICRIERAEHDFTLRTFAAPEIDSAIAAARREQVVAHSRETYARPLKEIEAQLAVMREESGEVTPELRRRGESTRAEAAPARSVSAPRKPEAATLPKPAHSVRKPDRPIPDLTALPGRGGREHKYLQHLVKRLAEDRGFKATIEEPILGGVGHVDVSLTRGEERIACEISVTTEVAHEIGNAEKCLAAGYETVALLASDAKVRRKLQSALETDLTPESLARTRVLDVDGLLAVLDQEAAAAAGGEAVVRGYRVKVAYSPVGASETAARRSAVSQVLARRLKRAPRRDDTHRLT